jgi:hypothetical protein
MIPIYEQKNGRGIGHSTDDFLKRFGEICTEQAQRSESSKFPSYARCLENKERLQNWIVWR